MPRPKQRTPELRAHVLEVALELLDRGGRQALTARRVARTADTSVAAVYELFGDKAGLVRAVFFEGFRRLAQQLGALRESADPRADVEAAAGSFRAFARRCPALIDVMFACPFEAFEPGPSDLAAAAAVRGFVIARLQRCVEAGLLTGDANDLAHVVLATLLGLARQEAAGWLGRSEASRDRRWQLAIATLFASAAGPPRHASSGTG